MSDEPESNAQASATAEPTSANSSRPKRDYSDEDKYTALAALDINGGNVYRTAIAFGLPESTLRTWRDERAARGGGPSNLEKERRGSLAAKLEDKVHSVIESITDKVIEKATLAQRGVFVGIGLDHLSKIRRTQETDPGVELARMLGGTAKQLPPSLQLAPGESIPDGLGPVIETVPRADNPNSYEVEDQPNPSPITAQPELPAHAPDCLGFTDINDNQFKNCSCGLIPEPEPEDDSPAN